MTYPLLCASKASGDDGERAPWLAIIIAFLTTLAFFALHEVARELEDPFLHPPNEAPIGAVQTSFNKRLVSIWSGLESLYRQQSDTGLVGLDASTAVRLRDKWAMRHHGEIMISPSGGDIELTDQGDRKSRRRESVLQSVRQVRERLQIQKVPGLGAVQMVS